MHTRQEHIDMMRDPDKWPMWPVLPLIHDETRAMAYMLDQVWAGDSLPIVLHGPFTNWPATYEECPTTDYGTHDKIYDAGWRVD